MKEAGGRLRQHCQQKMLICRDLAGATGLEPATSGGRIDLHDGGAVYRVKRVEPPPNPSSFGHAWARRIDGS
jgi:hypothetical protein